MSYTMMAADKIFDGSRFLENKVLVISGEGRIEEIIPVSDAGEEVSFHQGILCPGLIICHYLCVSLSLTGRMMDGVLEIQ